MKTVTILSITGLMMVSAQSNSTLLENSQLMPPPGPYKSVMNNTPPAFVPYGYQQIIPNTHQQSPQGPYGGHIQNSHINSIRGNMQPPEWLLVRQKESMDRLAALQKENDQRYAEYLKRAEENSNKRNETQKQWIEKTNAEMKKYWKDSLDKFSKNQKQQIERAKNLPDWLKKQLQEQYDQQLTMMRKYPPMPVQNAPVNSYTSTNNFRPMQPSAFYQQRQMPDQRSQFPANQPMMQPQFQRPVINNSTPYTNPAYKQSPVPVQPYGNQGFQPPYNHFPH